MGKRESDQFDGLDLSKLNKMLNAIDEAIAHEVAAQREYRAKAEMYGSSVFTRLEKMEKGHENALVSLKGQIMQRAQELRGE